MVDEGCERLAELSSILGAQVDLVHGAADPEPNRLIRRTAVKIVFKRDGFLLRHPGLPDCNRLPSPYKINCHAGQSRCQPQSPNQRAKPRANSHRHQATPGHSQPSSP